MSDTTFTVLSYGKCRLSSTMYPTITGADFITAVTDIRRIDDDTVELSAQREFSKPGDPRPMAGKQVTLRLTNEHANLLANALRNA